MPRFKHIVSLFSRLTSFRPLALAAVFSTLMGLGGIAACSDDTTTSKDARPAAERIGDRDATGADATGADATGADATGADATGADATGADATGADDLFRSDASTCAEVGATGCFSNLDCAADRRCQSLDGAGKVVCCVPGARGTKKAGEPCTRETDCASAVCIAKGAGPSVCSKDCASASDCPAGMKDCKTVAFSGSSQKWCFPQ